MHLNGAINSVFIMLNKPKVRVFTKSHVNTKPLYKVDMWLKWIRDDKTLNYISIKNVTDYQTNYFYDLRCN